MQCSSGVNGIKYEEKFIGYWRGLAKEMDEEDLNAYVISLFYRLAGRNWAEIKIADKVIKDLTGKGSTCKLRLAEPAPFGYKPPISFRIANDRGTLCEIEIAKSEIFLYTDTLVYSIPYKLDHFVELTAKVCFLLCSAGIELTEERADVFPALYSVTKPYLSRYMLAGVIHNLVQLFDVLSNYCSK